MDLNDLKNLNMDDIKAKVLAFADKKTLIKIGISVGSIIVFLIIASSSLEAKLCFHRKLSILLIWRNLGR